ncbi:hypothetical protein ACFT8P_14560 [Streptomyces sp. NPDC057101]
MLLSYGLFRPADPTVPVGGLSAGQLRRRFTGRIRRMDSGHLLG